MEYEQPKLHFFQTHLSQKTCDAPRSIVITLSKSAKLMGCEIIMKPRRYVRMAFFYKSMMVVMAQSLELHSQILVNIRCHMFQYCFVCHWQWYYFFLSFRLFLSTIYRILDNGSFFVRLDWHGQVKLRVKQVEWSIAVWCNMTIWWIASGNLCNRLLPLSHVQTYNQFQLGNCFLNGRCLDVHGRSLGDHCVQCIHLTTHCIRNMHLSPTKTHTDRCEKKVKSLNKRGAFFKIYYFLSACNSRSQFWTRYV